MESTKVFFQNVILKPHECTLLSCLPQSIADYQQQKNSVNHDFVSGFTSSWAKYQYEIGDTLAALLPKIRATGATVCERVCLSDFRQAFQPSVKLLILIGHHKDEQIEFFDGLYSFSKVADEIPVGAALFFDLCICNPLKFTQLLKMRFPNSLIRFTNTRSSITYWLYYYLLLMTYLRDNNTDIFHAFEAITSIFHELKKEKNA